MKEEEKNNFKIREDYFHSSWWLANFWSAGDQDEFKMCQSCQKGLLQVESWEREVVEPLVNTQQ